MLPTLSFNLLHWENVGRFLSTNSTHIRFIVGVQHVTAHIFVALEDRSWTEKACASTRKEQLDSTENRLVPCNGCSTDDPSFHKGGSVSCNSYLGRGFRP